MEWIYTFIEEHHFPFYEFLWVCMIVLWWSVIHRLDRIENKVDAIENADQELLDYLMDENE